MATSITRLLYVRTTLLYFSTFFVTAHLWGQTLPDTQPVIFRLHNGVFIRPGLLEWEIEVESAKEQYFWANATLDIRFENAGELRLAEFSVITTGLPVGTANQAGRSGYTLRTHLDRREQRLYIGILGPDETQGCVLLQPGKPVLIARCALQLGEMLPAGQIPTIRWKMNPESHTTTAIKTPKPILEQGFERFAQNDNREIPIEYVQSGTTEFAPANIVVDSLRATYIGDNLVRVSWNTQQERIYDRVSNLNVGFILRRNGQSIFVPRRNEDFRDTVATFSKHPSLRITGRFPDGKRYEVIDSVPQRSYFYQYELHFMDASSRLVQPVVRFIDTADATVPNAVIWYAQANPNPCASSTLVDFRIEDRIYLHASLYTLDGRLVERYINGEEYTRGNYLLPVFTEKLAFGAYHLVFEGMPINDTSVRRSRAIVRLQVSR